MTGGGKFVQVWIPLGLAAWAGIFLGQAILGHNVFQGGVLDWLLAFVVFLVVFLPIWPLWGFICGLFGYGQFPMIRGFEIGWEKAIDWTGRSHKYGRPSRQDNKKIKQRMEQLARDEVAREVGQLKAQAKTPEERARIEAAARAAGIEPSPGPVSEASSNKSRVMLSARHLDDVPESVRIGSPYDASDDDVWELAKVGVLHPQTNYGVVYRIAFAARIEPREQPITMRVMFATSQPASASVVRKPTTDDAAWLLVTSYGLRWHFVVDGMPGTAANPQVPRPEGPRNAEYASIRPVDVGLGREFVAEYAGPFGGAAFDFFGFRQETAIGEWVHAFGLSPGYETDALMNEVHERIAFAHDRGTERGGH